MTKKILALLALMIFAAPKSQAAIYYLTTEAELSIKIRNGFIFDLSLEQVGYIHASTVGQVVGAANRHYKGKTGTLILRIDEKLLKSPLRYDYVERHNQYFPHIYGPINMSAVVKIYKLPTNDDGTYRLPDELQDACKNSCMN